MRKREMKNKEKVEMKKERERERVERPNSIIIGFIRFFG
jgi:hypothetical protein